MQHGNFAKALVLAGFVAVLSFAPMSGAAAAETYSFDKGHTEIRFLWNHVGLSEQSGEFREYDGTIVWDKDKIENSKIDVSIKVASMDTGVKALDDDLLSENYFDAAKFPLITFKSTSVKQTGVDRGRVTGDLTIHGVTRPAQLDVRLLFQGDHPLAGFFKSYAGAPYAAFSARGEVLRSAFGVARSVPLVSDRIQIVIETEMRQLK